MPVLAALNGRQDRADALTVAGRTCGYEELLGAAGAVARRAAGTKAFAVEATASLETVAAVVGGLLAGVPVVPIAPDAGPDERAHILRDSGAELLPVDFSERADHAGGPAGDTALVLYTSGTTGPPKGVLISREAVAAGLDAVAAAWQWTADDTLVHGLPLFHVHGLVLGVLGALRTGSRLVHTGRPTPAAYAAAGGSLYFGVPTVWHRVVQDEDAARALSGARLLVSGSAPLPAPVFEDLRRLTGHRPVERYGMTETLITLSTRAAGERRPGVVGTPLPGVVTRIADAADGIGELQLKGPTLFDGYLGRPEATAASYTADGWFRTGDIAAIEPDGVHRIVGRASTDLIKTGGYRVGAGEVENALLAHPAVREAAVVGVPHDDLGQQIVAYVVAGEVSAAELTDFVAARLAAHKRPRVVRFLAELPRNAMGKPQKRLLPPL
ncbi:AMP-binding protein [Streptomyces sp. SID4948]|nr:AMP-binding protein [Streptomyces sp. SID4948]